MANFAPLLRHHLEKTPTAPPDPWITTTMATTTTTVTMATEIPNLRQTKMEAQGAAGIEAGVTQALAVAAIIAMVVATTGAVDERGARRAAAASPTTTEMGLMDRGRRHRRQEQSYWRTCQMTRLSAM